MDNIVKIAVNELYPHPDNPRKDLGDLTELSDSIKENGIYQNLTVVRGHYETEAEYIKAAKAEGVCKADAKGSFIHMSTYLPDGYTIIIGHRRAEAAKLAGLDALPCAVVDMTEAEQLRTMMVENMQRSDLTNMEQAQGFQLMMDLGDTVEEIAKKSGFSQTTVRRRVKLLSLDRAKLLKAEKRGATMADYILLDKLESEDAKNRVLDAIGTDNFNQRLQTEIDAEKYTKRRAHIKALLDTFAVKVDDVDRTKYEYNYTFNRWSVEKEFTVPEKENGVDYVYTDRTDLTLYKTRTEPVKSKEQIEREAKELARKQAQAALESELVDITKTAKELRDCFVRGLTEKECAKQAQAIAKLTAMAYAKMVYEDIDYERIESLLNVNLGLDAEDVDDDDEKWATSEGMAEACKKNPCKSLLVMAIAAIDRCEIAYWEKHYNWKIGYEYEHSVSNGLDAIYEALGCLGYNMSDVEKQMQDGTHEIFARCAAESEAEHAEV